MSEVTLFRKYGSKAELVIAAIAHEGAIFRLSETGYTGDLRDDLKTIVSLYLEAAEEHGAFFATMLAEMPRHEELRGALDQPLTIMTHIAGIVDRYQVRGLLRPGPPMHIVAALVGPLMTMTLVKKVIKGRAPFPNIPLDEYVDRFLAGYEGK
jgi:AcrR family transcriptional regulator